LSLWRTKTEFLHFIKLIQASEDFIKDAKVDKTKAQALVERLRKARKSNEAGRVVARLHKLDCHSRREQRWLKQAKAKGLPILLEFRAAAEKQFADESIAALRCRNFKAFNALERVWKRWKAEGQPHYRTLGILELVLKKAVDAAWKKGGAAARFHERALWCDRVLVDREWPQLTAREFHSHLVNVKAFLRTQDEGEINEQLHEVRRLVRGMGMKLQPDRRGRKPRSKNRN
jgi:hypothetical protein